MGKSYKDKFKRNQYNDNKRNKHNKRNKSGKFEFDYDDLENRRVSWQNGENYN
jgi:hypothetical protein